MIIFFGLVDEAGAGTNGGKDGFAGAFPKNMNDGWNVDALRRQR